MSLDFDIDYGISNGVRNREGQEFRMETKGDEICFVILDGDKRAEFKISYNNKVIIENIKKQFVDCAAHTSTVHNAMIRKGLTNDTNTTPPGDSAAI
jgi:3-deoxy-D-arabino-heptulosonate 7-phosphate (DAHP) synthase